MVSPCGRQTITVIYLPNRDARPGDVYNSMQFRNQNGTVRKRAVQTSRTLEFCGARLKGSLRKLGDRFLKTRGEFRRSVESAIQPGMSIHDTLMAYRWHPSDVDMRR